MSTRREGKSFIFPEGFFPDQPMYNGGVPGSVYAGLNVAFEGAGIVRTIAPPEELNEFTQTQTISFSAELTAGSDVVNVPLVNLFNLLVPYQIVRIEREIYVVEEIITNTTMRVSPTPQVSLTGQQLATVPALHAVDNQRAGQEAGNTIKYRDEAFFAAGRGQVWFNGLSLSLPLNASPTPQIAYPPPNGLFTYDSRAVGFTKPSVPSITGVAGGTKNMPAMPYSIKITRKRLGFPGYGPASEAVEASLTAGQRFQVTLPVFDSAQGQTAWLIWATKARAGEAQGGPWYLLGEFTTVTPGTVTVEWRNDELTERLVDNNFPPPPSLFVASMDDVLIFGSCYGRPDALGNPTAPGPGLALAKPNNPNGFPASAAAFTSPAENVRGIRTGGARLFAMTANHLHIGTLTGSAETPLVIRPMWQTGFWHQYSGCMVKDTFYGFTGNTLSRTTGDGTADSSFSARVKSELASYDPRRVFVGHDPRNGWVVVFHSNHRQDDGFWITRALSYNYKTDKWNCPVELRLPGVGRVVTSCATVGGELYMTDIFGETCRWDPESGTASGFLTPIFQDGGSVLALKTLRRVQVSGKFNGSLFLYKNFDDDNLIAGTGSPPTFVVANPTFKSQHSPLWKPNFKGKSIALRIAFADMPARARIIDAAEVKGETREDANY